jgi:predicted TIM-barrel fold metal-dependent hydrolase
MVATAATVVTMLGGCRKERQPSMVPTRTNDAEIGTNPRHLPAYLPGDDPKIGIADLKPRRWKIVDVHEHVQGERDAERLLGAMDRLGIDRTCLMGSTEYTLTLNAAYGFEGFKENNEAILAIKKKHPDRFCAFVTLNPLDDNNLRLLQDYVARGADGLKLYLGHGGSTGKGPFHSMRLDDARMEAVFAWAEAVQLPIVLHVNLEKFWDETVNLLEKHPYLRVDLPHFGLEKGDSRRLMRLGFLLNRYPYVYTDVSAGYYTFQTEAFEMLAMNRPLVRAFCEAYGEKIMYGADMVVEPHKDDAYIVNTARSYMQFLESDRWRFFLQPTRIMLGLGLDDQTLRKVYELAPRAFLLADENGRLPDRTRGWPSPGVREPARPRIPPEGVSAAGRPDVLSRTPSPTSSTFEARPGSTSTPDARITR